MPTNPRPNPYVGPRAFQTGEKLYGRDSELQQLLDLLIAERIVLLYSPSGAGKSSLVQAGLIPCLKAEGFHVLPVARVNLDPPSGIDLPPEFNRYVFSALLSLEEGLPEDQQLPVEKLASIALDEYLAQRPRREEDPDTDVLIFDQFEEIVTREPMDRPGKMAFFSQVGTALRNRKRWGLFSMREDYVPSLDPYLRPIPTRLANNFRLDLLGVEASRQAIQNPAREAGVEMTGPGAKKLIDDLRRVQVQRPDGVMEEQLGLYVEPVQLQVVCYRLWQNLAPEQARITEEDLENIGDVDESLAEYYAERVAAVVTETAIPERAIRDWFDRHLIAEGGIRSQVMMGPEKSDGLDNRAIRLLEDAHLVRAEKRRGATWFELAHDRLIKPVNNDNARWAQAHLSLLQRQATLWETQDHFDGLVLREGDLLGAEQWAAEHPGELTEIDKAFLKRCQDLRLQEQEARAAAERQLKLEAAEKLAQAERKRAEEQTLHASQLRRRAVYLVIALLLALGMAALAGTFWKSASESEMQQRTVAAEKIQIASTSASNAGTAQAASTKAISESFIAGTAEADAKNQKATAEAEKGRAEDALKTVVAQKAEIERQGSLERSNSLALLSAEYLDRQANLALLLGIESYRWNEESWNAINALFSGLGRNIGRKAERAGEIPQQPFWIYDVAFSPNGRMLAWSGAEGAVVLWDLEAGKPLQNWFAPSRKTVQAVSFNYKGSLLAYGAANGIVLVRNISNGRFEKEIYTSFGSIADVAFSPNGKYLAISGDSRRIDLWDLDKWEFKGSLAGGTGSGPCSLAWSPPGNFLASACSDKIIRIWNPATGLEERFLEGHEGKIWSLAWSPDGRLLASAGEDDIGPKDKTLLIWDLNKRTFTPLPGHQDKVLAVAFSPDGRLLASASADRTVILWDTNGFIPIDQISDYGNWVTSLDFNAEGEPRLATASFDRTIRLYKILPRESLFHTLAYGKSLVKSLNYKSDTEITIVGGLTDGIALLDANTAGENEKPHPKINGRFSSAALHPNGKQVALAGEAGLIQIRDIQTGEVQQEFKSSEGRILSLAFDPSGNTLAIALCKDLQQDVNLCAQNEIQVWDLQQDPPEQVGCFPTDHTDAILSLAYDSSGKILASGGKDRSIWLYKGTLTGCPAQVEKTLLAVHTSGVSSLAFRRPDGVLLATGGQDGKLALWVVASRQKVGNPIQGNGGELLSLAFSPDGKSLASGDEDGIVLLWDMDVASWMRRACDLAGRNLTQSEWSEFISGAYRQTCEQWPAGE